MKHLIRSTVALLFLSAHGIAFAVPVQYEFTATLDGVGGSMGGSQFAHGDTVTGSLTYDTDAVDSFAPSTRGIYLGQPTAFTFTIDTASGPQAYTTSSTRIDIDIGNPAFDNVQFISQTISGPTLTSDPTADLDFVNLYWRDPSKPLTTDALTADLPSMLTGNPTFLLNFDPADSGNGTYNLRFEVTDLSRAGTPPIDAPEPHTALLLAGGVIWLGLRRRRLCG